MGIYGSPSSTDTRIAHAEREVLRQFGDSVSVRAKAKSLNKFGNNLTVGTAFETVAEFQGSVANETYETTNAIDTVVSSNAGDTQIITIEGHTIDGIGNITFSTQQVTLTGQTPVLLSPPLARANRAFVTPSGVFLSPSAEFAGNVSVYNGTGGVTAGVPNTAADTKLQILAGKTQSGKCATSISQSDYWFISNFSAAIGNAGGSATLITVRMERRDIVNGGAWRPFGRDITLVKDQTGRSIPFDPFLIVQPNHDWRVRAKTNSNTAEIYAEASGYLAAIV